MAALPHGLLGALVLATSLAQAADPSRIIDLECDYLPNICNHPEDASPGMMIEIGSEAIRRAGFSPQVKIRPWNRAMREILDRPNAVIIYFARTPEREALFRWISVVASTDFRFFTKDGAAPCHTLPQAVAAGLIGVRTGSSVISWLTQQGIDNRQLEPGQLAEMAKMLKAGRVGSFLGAAITFNTVYQQQIGQLPVAGNVVYSSQNWIAAGPRFSPDTAARIAAALSRMKQEGFVDQVMRKYTK